MASYKTILAALDLRTLSEQVLRRALEVATGDVIHLLHMPEPLTIYCSPEFSFNFKTGVKKP